MSLKYLNIYQNTTKHLNKKIFLLQEKSKNQGFIFEFLLIWLFIYIYIYIFQSGGFELKKF